MSGRVNHPGQFSARTTPLFWSVFNERQHVEPKSAIKAIITQCGIDFSAHDLRRTFGTLFDEQGRGDYATKRALNHAPSDTASRHYLKARMMTLRTVYQAYEDSVLIEAGVKAQPATAAVISAEEYAQFQAWLAERGSSNPPMLP